MCRNCKPINLARDSSPTNPSGLDGSPLAEDQIGKVKSRKGHSCVRMQSKVKSYK
jgi:hypothetical protein